jgi:hypothetical protein
MLEQDAVGLIIADPWISRILSGDKVWEMRSTRLSRRGTIALIRKGSGHVVGVATITGCIGPLSDVEVVEHFCKHKVPLEQIGQWRYAWQLFDVKPLPHPVSYVHKSGAVKFVRLDPDVVRRVNASLHEPDARESSKRDGFRVT